MCKKKLSRRNFLKFSALGTCGAAVHTAMTPGFNMVQYANAQALTTAQHLFVINLAGGASYNIAPIYNSAWYDKNPNVSYQPADSLPLANGADQGFHPSLAYFKELYDDGDLALLNQVAFSERASRSHSTAAQMWMTGSISPNGKNGVLNSLSCRATGNGLFSGVSLAGSDPIAEGSCAKMRKLEGLDGLEGRMLRLNDDNRNQNYTDETTWLNMQRKKLAEADNKSSTTSRSFVKSAIESMDESADQINETLDGATIPNVGVNAPNNDFRDAMNVFQASSVLGTQMYYLEIGGFDTHSAERNRMAGRLNQVNQGVEYIAKVAKALNAWNNVTIMVFTEFARTFENSAEGTDHGEVAPLFLMGGRVNGRQVNAAPTVSKINASNNFMRNPEIDTRTVWYNIINNGLGLTPSGILDASGYSLEDLNLFS